MTLIIIQVQMSAHLKHFIAAVHIQKLVQPCLQQQACHSLRKGLCAFFQTQVSDSSFRLKSRKGTHALLLHTEEPGQQQRPAVGTLCSVCLRTQLSQQQLFNSLQGFSAIVELALQVQLAQCRSEYVHVC